MIPSKLQEPTFKNIGCDLVVTLIKQVVRPVLMRGHNLYFDGDFTKLSQNHHQLIYPLICNSNNLKGFKKCYALQYDYM